MNLAAYAARLSMWIWDFGRGKVWTTTKLRVNAGLPARAPVDFDQVLETVHPEDRERFDRAVRQAVAKDEELDVEYRVLQPHGAVRWIAARGRAEKSAGERMMGVSMDITARKEAELHAEEADRSLTHASRLAVVGELTAMVAHEINQPLRAILSNADAAEMLLDSADPPLDDIREILSDIRTSDLRANEAIVRIRALLSKREICLQPVDLNAVIVEVLRLAAADLLRRQIAVRHEPRPSLPPVSGDRVHLQQVLLNLFVNAMDAMKDTPLASRLLAVSTRRDGADSVEVVVADRGHGIAPDKLSGSLRVLLHHQERRHGARTVDRTFDRPIASRPHLGREPGRRRGGLPLHREGRARRSRMTDPGLPAPLIHVVDDDADFQAAVSRLLRAAGYEVRCYASAGEFLVAAFDDRPGCVLLDVRMPGPSGLELQDALARMTWHRPIIFMSGYSDIPTTVQAIQAGAVDFLAKPIPRDTLLGAVRNALMREAEERIDRERLEPGALASRPFPRANSRFSSASSRAS